MNRNGLLITLAATALSAGCVAYTGSKVAPLAGSLVGAQAGSRTSGLPGKQEGSGGVLGGTSDPAGVLAEPAVVGTAVGPSDRPGHGTLTLTIRWPARSVQAIPASTKVIRIEVWNGASILQEDGTDVAVEVTRPDGQATSSASVDVPQGGPYEVRVKAYKDLGARTDAYLVAQGTTSVTVQANEASNLALTLTPVGGLPTVSRISPSHGAPGSLFDIVGTNFGDLGDTPPTVTLGGVAVSIYSLERATSAGQESTASILVPDGAGSGPVTLTRDGLTAASTPLFTVLSSISIQVPASPLTANATYQCTVEGIATPSGEVYSNPLVAWGVYDPNNVFPASIDPDTGVLSTYEAGSVWVEAYLGNLIATKSVSIQ